jgi:phage terminase small subunit
MKNKPLKFEPPKYMLPVAKAEFIRAQDVLETSGLLDDMDLSLLIDYANTFQDVEDLTIAFMSSGQNFTQFTNNNGTVVSGEYSLLNQQREQLRKLRTDLGFTVRQRHGRRKVSTGSQGKVTKDSI